MWVFDSGRAIRRSARSAPQNTDETARAATERAKRAPTKGQRERAKHARCAGSALRAREKGFLIMQIGFMLTTAGRVFAGSVRFGEAAFTGVSRAM